MRVIATRYVIVHNDAERESFGEFGEFILALAATPGRYTIEKFVVRGSGTAGLWMPLDEVMAGTA